MQTHLLNETAAYAWWRLCRREQHRHWCHWSNNGVSRAPTSFRMVGLLTATSRSWTGVCISTTDVVVHQENFVDPLHPEIHTKNVENLWMRAKRKLRRQFGTTRQLFDTYLREFVWQVRHKGHQHRLAALLVCIRQQYPCWAETEEKKRFFSEPTI